MESLRLWDFTISRKRNDKQVITYFSLFFRCQFQVSPYICVKYKQAHDSIWCIYIFHRWMQILRLLLRYCLFRNTTCVYPTYAIIKQVSYKDVIFLFLTMIFFPICASWILPFLWNFAITTTINSLQHFFRPLAAAVLTWRYTNISREMFG